MNIAGLPIETTNFILKNIGKIGLYLQAIGIIVLIWISFQIINLKINYQIKKKITKIEKEILLIKKYFKKSYAPDRI